MLLHFSHLSGSVEESDSRLCFCYKTPLWGVLSAVQVNLLASPPLCGPGGQDSNPVCGAACRSILVLSKKPEKLPPALGE